MSSNDKKSFKVLSIDGGGIKGLYSAVVLDELEKKYGSIGEHFDLICGTSTGGIIALCIATGKPVSEVVSLYKEYGPKIFPSNKIKLLWNCIKHRRKYDTKPLYDKLEEILETKLLDNSKCCLCIPASSSEKEFQPTVFKTSHNSILTRDRNVTMLKVAKATTAAPAYFSKVEISNISKNLTDGGLWMNNPCFTGIIEAMTYFVGQEKEYRDIKVLSIGNIQEKTKICDSLIGWLFGPLVVKKMLTLQSRTFEEILNLFKRKNIFPISTLIRIEKTFKENEKYQSVSLDDTSRKTLSNLEEWAKEDVQNTITTNNIEIFFQEKTKRWTFPAH